MHEIDDIDKKIIKVLQDNFPLTSRPYLEAAKKIGVDEEEIIERIKRLKELGIVRRISANVRHRKIGIKANAMIAWKVPESMVEEVGRKLASFEEVTHCYERETIPEKWDYNVFTMIHGYSKDEVEKIVREISEKVGIKDYIILYSVKEYKKTYKKFEG